VDSGNILHDDPEENAHNTLHNAVKNLISKCKYYDFDELNLINSKDFRYTSIHINIHSLPSKYDQLLTLLANMKDAKLNINFIMLCETFLTNLNYDKFSIPGYQFVQRHRINRKGGGVCIYISDIFQVKERDDLSLNIASEFESIFIEITNLTKKLIVGEIYRVPGTSEHLSIDRYNTILQKLNNFKGDIIIGTDQNFNYLNTETHANTLNLLDTFISAGFLPTITKPTRITYNSSTLIDNIYVRTQSLQTLSSGIITTYISDHLPIFMFLGKQTSVKKQPIIIKYRALDNTAIDNIKSELDNINWDILDTYHLNEAVNFLSTKILITLDLHAPEKTRLISRKNQLRQPWMSSALLNSSKSSDKLFKKSLGKPADSDAHIKYITYRNLFNKAKRASKLNYYSDLLTEYKHDSRKTWSVLNTLTGRKNNKCKISDSFKLDNGTLLTNPKLINNAFCKYFTEVGSKFAAEIPPPSEPFNKHMPPKSKTSLFMYPTDPEEINKITSSLKPKTSLGHDRISSKLIKLLSNSIKIPLSKIINKSLESGMVPHSWKIAKVIPIHKSKEKTKMNNYRPISLLPSLSKVLEKIVHHRLYQFLNMQDILYSRQFGFRPKHSTIHAVTNFIAHVQNAIEQNNLTVSVLLDLSKAFDTIDHKILLAKLDNYGVRGLALEWFRSYLSDRSQYVSYKDTNSDSQFISCGVPQGSVLGPLLFIVYTNDLPNSLKHSQCILFADDTTVYKSSPNIHDAITSIESDLENLYDWFCANKLSLNVGKTNFIIFSPRPAIDLPATIKLGENAIHRVNCAKFLGVYIDDELEWDQHIKYVSSRLNSGCYAINSVKRILPLHNLKQLYYSLVHSHITYGTTLWGSAHKYKLKKIEVAQNKSIRNIFNAPYNAHTSILYKKLNIPKLHDIYQIQLGKFMYDYSTSSLPPPLQSLFTPNRDIHNHNTRNSNNPHIISRTFSASKSFLHQCPKLWSSLPHNIKSSKTPKTFSQNIKSYFTKRYS
jgi:hypothetical protein